MVSNNQTPNLESNLQALQGDVVKCLKEISELMGRVRNILSSDGSGEKYGKFQEEIKNAAYNVQKLELRMAVVAPMKAGKSTIVNAIVGQDLLPSRNAAMTTLPTEIIFNAEIQEPVLKLTPKLQEVFQKTVLSLQNQMNELSEEEIQEKTAQYPHLFNLRQEIENSEALIKDLPIYGREEITNVLTTLNDIIRLCSVLDPLKDPLATLFDVPRLETPFLRFQDRQTEKLGNLVIVDTPGPNEAGENLRLSGVVEEQLQRSSIVLIVLDFTQLNNKAAEEVKKQVQPIIELIGKDNLYVLVNKVDQRRKGDMKTEQVKDFVYADLNLTVSSQTERIFEISAIRAFTAAKYLLECQQNSDLDLDDSATNLKTAEALAQEVFGIDWEEDLEEATIKELVKKANRLWNKSGFAPFLEKAINALMESAAPLCMSSALNLSRSRLLEIKDELKLRNSAIAKDEEKLRQEIDALEADLKCLELSRSKLTEVDKIRAALQHNLKQVLDSLKELAKVSIKDYFGEEDYQRANLVQKVGIVLSKPLSSIERFDILGLVKQIKYKTSDKIEFNTKPEADKFAKEAVYWAKRRAEKLLSSTQEYTSQEIDKACRDLIESLEQRTKPIIEKARNRLTQEFDIELSFPEPPSWEDDSLSNTQISVNYATRQKTIQKSDRKRRWYVLWLLEIEHTWEEVKDEDYYYVSLNSLTKTFNDSVTETVNNINSQIVKYLDEDFKKQIDDYFDYLNNYLRNYSNSLKQAQKDQQSTLDKKEQLTKGLSSLIPETEKQITQVDTYLERTENCMPKSPEN